MCKRKYKLVYWDAKGRRSHVPMYTGGATLLCREISNGFATDFERNVIDFGRITLKWFSHNTKQRFRWRTQFLPVWALVYHCLNCIIGPCLQRVCWIVLNKMCYATHIERIWTWGYRFRTDPWICVCKLDQRGCIPFEISDIPFEIRSKSVRNHSAQ